MNLLPNGDVVKTNHGDRQLRADQILPFGIAAGIPEFAVPQETSEMLDFFPAHLFVHWLIEVGLHGLHAMRTQFLVKILQCRPKDGEMSLRQQLNLHLYEE